MGFWDGFIRAWETRWPSLYEFGEWVGFSLLWFLAMLALLVAFACLCWLGEE